MNNYYKMSNKSNKSNKIKQDKKEKSKKNIDKLNEINLLKIRKLKKDKQLYLENIILKLKNDINNINKNLLTKCEHKWKREYDDGPENRTDYICCKCYNYKSDVNRM